jgi:hypothetical protein
MRRPEALIALLLVLALAGACGKKKAEPQAQRSPLFTGKEAQREVLLTLPSLDKPGFVQVKRSIYGTQSSVAQAKQILLALMAGPASDGSEAGVAPCFGPGASFRELFLDGKNMAVVDLPKATVDALPGGTSAEVATLYCVIRSLSMNLPGVSKVRFMVDGEEAESLRGHVDLRDPLGLVDF